MNTNFAFNSNKYDLWEIYEVIKKYYPIGISRNEGRGIYLEYKGIQALEKIIADNIHNSNNYQDRWESFTTQIGKELNKEIIGTTYGQAPSFSSSIILQKNELEDCIHKKELHFSVSLIGNFYQIYGLDTTTVLDVKEQKGFHAVNAVTTSPYAAFKEYFEFVERRIQEKYLNYKIVPFGFGQAIIRGLEVRYLDDFDCSINKGLFNHFLSEENISKFIRGDKNYGKEMWAKKED